MCSIFNPLRRTCAVRVSSPRVYTLVLLHFICRKETKAMKMKRVPELRRSSLVSSLVSNAVYVSHRDSIFPEFPYNKINTVSYIREFCVCVIMSCYYMMSTDAARTNFSSIFEFWLFPPSKHPPQWKWERGIRFRLVEIQTVLLDRYYYHWQFCVYIKGWKFSHDFYRLCYYSKIV